MYESSVVKPKPQLMQLTISEAAQGLVTGDKPSRVDICLNLIAGVINDNSATPVLVSLANFIYERPELRVHIEETINYKDLP